MFERCVNLLIGKQAKTAEDYLRLNPMTIIDKQLELVESGGDGDATTNYATDDEEADSLQSKLKDMYCSAG